MDKNTERYMVEELQEELAKKEEELKKKDEEIAYLRQQLTESR